MARVKNGILGAFSGKVGTVIGYVVNGNAYMRGVSAREKVMTENELINQAKFKLVQDYVAPLKELLKAGFKGYYYTPTGGYRAAVSYTRKVALVTDDAGFYIDPALVKISGGNLAQAIDPKAEFEAPDMIKVTWNKEKVEGVSNTDQIMVAVYDMSDFKAQIVVFDGAFRRDGVMRVQIDTHYKNKPVDVYVGFINGDRTAQSDSQYLGRVDVPA